MAERRAALPPEGKGVRHAAPAKSSARNARAGRARAAVLTAQNRRIDPWPRAGGVASANRDRALPAQRHHLVRRGNERRPDRRNRHDRPGRRVRRISGARRQGIAQQDRGAGRRRGIGHRCGPAARGGGRKPGDPRADRQVRSVLHRADSAVRRLQCQPRDQGAHVPMAAAHARPSGRRFSSPRNSCRR